MARRLESLTVIRFFAAIYVVLYHFSGRVIPFWSQIGSGYLGVDLFFVLSGFILMYNYGGDDVISSSGFYRRFFSARFARVYPAFLLGFILAAPTAILYAFRRHPGVEALTKITTAGVSTLLLIHAWSPRLAPFWNFPSWSVSCEAFFYLCFPFLALRLRGWSVRRSLLVSIACAMLAPGLFSYVLVKGPSAGLENMPIARIAQFALGMAVGQIFLTRQHRSPLGALWALLAIGLTIATAAFLPRVPYFPRIFVATPVFALLIYTLARSEQPDRGKKGFAWRGLVLLGDASYSIYILQWPVFWMCGLSVPTMSALKLLVYLALLIAVSIAALMLVEKPLRRMLIRALSAPKVPEAGVASLAAAQGRA